MAVDPNQKKKIAIIPSAVVCHIDESALFDKQVGCAEKLQETCKARYPDLPFISQPLQDIFGPEFLVDANFSGTMKKLTGDNEYVELTQGTTTTTTNEEKLRNLFQTINKNTAKEDLFWYLKFAMLTKIAQREGCEYVFLADSSTRQAIKMISYISHGRGYSIPLDVGLEVDGLYADLTVLRPMKDMLAKEMGLYNRIHRIEQDVTVPQNWTTYMPPKTSIEKLTEDFIVGLDHDFPSTVSTISRTASKLTPQSNLDYSKKCAICLM
ncbi:hypothetical protein DM01DRAFT_1279130 [Hesseltinella vesiculosa]|uniref:Uncharacterized protein n=1 Tax=Hesseltinella vesiculosa TaxID=101127 RepID=A0A1X2GWX8_9FUNG|nr:hypothetical protein DM01DRAFT_1279130 [Hesseltinella vesiculosa]